MHGLKYAYAFVIYMENERLFICNCTIGIIKMLCNKYRATISHLCSSDNLIRSSRITLFSKKMQPHRIRYDYAYCFLLADRSIYRIQNYEARYTCDD